MYQIGNLIFYESSGVCKVMGVTMRDLMGQNKEQLYYVLEPLYQNYIIFTLVNTTKVFMRPIISKNEAERLVDMMPTIQARAYHNRVLSQLTQHYNALLKTHDCSDLVIKILVIITVKLIISFPYLIVRFALSFFALQQKGFLLPRRKQLRYLYRQRAT